LKRCAEAKNFLKGAGRKNTIAKGTTRPETALAGRGGVKKAAVGTKPEKPPLH
jgi:hypothetical protein